MWARSELSLLAVPRGRSAICLMIRRSVEELGFFFLELVDESQVQRSGVTVERSEAGQRLRAQVLHSC